MMPRINLQTLFEQAIYCEKRDIAGDFVECGVWKGGAVGMMALASKQFGKKPRNLHLFDAFDDICEPDPKVEGEKALNDFKKFTGKTASRVHGNTGGCKRVCITLMAGIVFHKYL